MFDTLIPLAHGIPLAPSLAASVDTIAVVLHPISHTLSHITQEGLILAQSTDADLVAEFQKAFKTFVDSGQVWAMLIGIIVGYIFRTFTTYG